MHTPERITSQRELQDLVEARYPLLYIVTFEEARVENLIKQVCRDREMRLEIWSVTEGFKTVFGGQGKRDISEIGLACVSDKPLPEMTLVALDFSLPGASEVHNLRGAVVRCEPLPKAEQPKGGHKYDVAIYFTEVQPVTRAALKNYVGKTKRAR